jgi:hypothetical protein
MASPKWRKIVFSQGIILHMKNLQFRWLIGQKQGYLSCQKSWLSASNSVISERRKPPKVLKPRFRLSGFGKTGSGQNLYVGQTPHYRRPEMVKWHFVKLYYSDFMPFISFFSCLLMSSSSMWLDAWHLNAWSRTIHFRQLRAYET